MSAERHVFKQHRFVCANCGEKQQPLMWDYEPAPTCGCGTQMTPEFYLSGKAPLVVGDDIPGGLEIRHGLCNEDGSPRRFYSRSEIAREAKARGLENIVRHVPAPGSDRSKNTQRFV